MLAQTVQFVAMLSLNQHQRFRYRLFNWQYRRLAPAPERAALQK